MKIVINDKNEIISFVEIGDKEGAIEIEESILPEGFIEGFESKKYVFVDEEIKLNQDFDDNPIEETPENVIEILKEENLELKLALAEIAELQQSDKIEMQLALAEIAELITGGDQVG